MTRYALLCGSAEGDYRQKKLEDTHSALTSSNGGEWKEKEITIFPNGLSEVLLEYSLNNCIDGKVFLYFCMRDKSDSQKDAIFLGKEEIRRSVIAHYEELFGSNLEIVYDFCSDFVMPK